MFLSICVSLCSSIASPQFAAESDRFGFSLANIGDVDGDGNENILIGDPEWGVTWIVSVEDQSVLFRFGPEDLQGRYSGMHGAPAGDTNNDGRADFLLVLYGESLLAVDKKQPRKCSVVLISGKDGAVLAEFSPRFGRLGGLFDPARRDLRANFGSTHQVAALDDVDSDGFDDFVVGNAVRSGGSGDVLYSLPVSGLEPVGDLNADSVADLCGIERNSPNDPGQVVFFCGATGAELFRLTHERMTMPIIDFARGTSEDGCLDLFAVAVPDLVLVFSLKDRQYKRNVLPPRRKDLIGKKEFMFGEELMWLPGVDPSGLCRLLIVDEGNRFIHGVHAMTPGKQEIEYSIGLPRNEVQVSLCLIGDQDDDNLGDLIVAACGVHYSRNTGEVAVHSSTSGKFIWFMTRESLMALWVKQLSARGK